MSLNDFSDPLAQLRAFHQQGYRMCEQLEALAEQALAGADFTTLRRPATEIYQHFSVAEVLHHQDEEQGLFPVLSRQSLKLADKVHTARREHETLAVAASRLSNFLMEPRSLSEQAEAFAAEARAFAEAQRNHSRFEDEELLELAGHIFSREQLRELGKAMAGRRSRR